MNQAFSFNLIDEKWIPCVSAKPVKTYSLRDMFANAHQLYDIAGDNPLQTVAIYRLLLAILLRVHQPDPEDDASWQQLWTQDRLDAARINRYLDKHYDRFDLFHPTWPFYQSDSDDARVRPQSAVSIKHGIGFLQSPLFDHANKQDGITMTPAQAARNLLAVQTFGLGGGHKGMFTAAPCATGVIFVMQGSTLQESLLLNLLPYPDDEREMIVDTVDDQPTWEMEDPFVDSKGQPFGLLHYLTWPNRRILLFPEVEDGQTVVKEVQIGGGLSLDKTIADPMKFFTQSASDGLLPYKFDEAQQLWRNSYALFASTPTARGLSRPPQAIRWLAEQVDNGWLDNTKKYRCKALGQRVGKKAGKIDYFRSEQFPFPLAYLTDEDLRNALQNALEDTAKIAYQMVQALRVVGFYLYVENNAKIRWKSVGINLKAKDEISEGARKDIANWIRHCGAEQQYWSLLDVAFQRFIVELSTRRDTALADWRREVRVSAETAFEIACQYAHQTDRSFQAIIHGSNRLHYQLNTLLGEKQHDTNN